MSIKQNQGFLLQSPVPTVLRDAVDTIVDLKNINDNYYPDNYIVLCNEDNTVYLYTKSNSIDATTGKCRKLVHPETPFDAFPIESNTSAVYSDGLYKWFKGYGDWDLGKTYTYKTSNNTRAPLVKRYDHKNVTSPTQESLFVTYDSTYTPYLSKTIHYDCTGTRNQDYYAVFCAPHSSAGAIKFDFTTKTLSGSSTDPDWGDSTPITCMFDTNHDRVSFAFLPKGFDIIASSVVGNEYTIAMKIPASYVGHLYFRTSGYFNDTKSTNGLTFMGASVLNNSVTWSFIYYNTLVDNLTTYDIVTYEQLQEILSFGTGSSILNYSLINSEHINIIEENTGSNSKTFNWAMDKAIYCSLWDKFTFLDTSKQPTLVAGNNITITNGNVISASVEVEGSVEMAPSTADVLKEKTLYFIPNNNVYDGYVRHISNITTTQIEHTAHIAGSGAPYYREVQKLGTYIYAVGEVQDGGTINRYAELLRSSDYGATWESTLVPVNRGIVGFHILNNLLIVTGVGSDNNSHLYTSSDYGDTWGEKQMPSNSSIHPIEYYNGNYYCIINGNVICKSPDLVTWESSTLPANKSSWGMAVFKGLLIAMSSGNYCCWTEDGVTWHTETFEVQGGGFGLWGFVTDGNIIICKSHYCWLTSYDGKHWTAHNPNKPAPGTTEPFLSAVLHDGKKWIVKKAFIQDAQEPSYVEKWFVGIDFDNLEEVFSFPPRSAVNYNQLISVGNKILAIDSDSVSDVDFNTSKIFEVNITYFEKVIDGASLKNHIDNKVMHLNTITIPTGNNGTSKCFKIMSIDDCSNFSNFTLLSNYVNDIGMVSNMSIDMLGIYDDSYGHKVFEHHVLGTPQVYCNKRTHMEEEQEILDGVDVYLYTTFFQNSNIVVTLLQGQNFLTDDITFGNLGTEEFSNLQNVVSKKMDILPIDSVKGLQDKLNTLAAPRYSIVTQLPKTVDAVANHTYYVKKDGIMCGYLKKNASWVEGEPQDHIVPQYGGEWQSIVYGKGVYVAIRNSEAIGYSYDGIAWYRAHILPGSSFYTIAYGNGMFVTCSISGDVAYSYDGINWFYSDSNAGGDPIDTPQIVKFFNDRFFIVSGAVLDKVAYSLDGITWTQVTLPSARRWADAAFGNGTYVVIYHGGDLAYSSDLANWTEIQLPSTNVDWIHVDFVPWLGKFIATAKAANFIAISSDGITWEQVSLPITTNLDWSKVVYNDYKIIMKANQSTKGLMSENGTSWTEFNVPSAMEYRDLAYGKGKFVIMGGTTVLQPVYLEEYVCISNS